MSLALSEERGRIANEERQARTTKFKGEIGHELESTSEFGEGLRNQLGDASNSARGMLGRASEVAAAAEQSAVAMREAAQTAAGLIRAIEDARTEVETASDVSNRAASQSSDAVESSERLSEHAKSIE